MFKIFLRYSKVGPLHNNASRCYY